MNDKIKRFAFYNIFFLCAFFSLFLVLELRSFADSSVTVNSTSWNNSTDKVENVVGYRVPDENRYCLYVHNINGWTNPNGEATRADLCTNSMDSFYQSYYTTRYIYSNDRWELYSSNSNNGELVNPYRPDYYSSLVQYFPGYSNHENFYIFEGWGNEYHSSSGLPIFYDLNDVYNYIDNGIIPEVPFDDTLKLDSFKVTSWQIGTSQLMFRSKFVVTWSDERISNVQVKIVGTANSPVSFEANQSPFKQKFYADNYVMKNGDVIHLTATPFKSNGEYGESLYYSIVYNDGLPSNWYRKLVNTPYNDNTLTIPYTNVSGQPQSVTLPVDGVTTNKVYKVNYNPVTYQYGDLNVYEIYYSPVVVYPDETSEEEIDETQEVVTNVYTTNNYNTINNNTNYDFEINFGDISNNDIQDSYDNVGNFINGFGSFIAKIVNFFGILFPFFPAGVSIAIITAFGIVALLLLVALVIKIVSAIKNFIF